MTGFVIDASVIIKALQKNEDGHQVAVDFIDQQLRKNTKLWVPEILFIEVANVMATKGESTQELIKMSLEWVYSLEMEVWTPSKIEMIDTALEAKKFGTAVFDMLYASLAKKEEVELVTADVKFAQKTGFEFVKVLQ